MLPRLTDVEPYLLTCIGASAMHGLKERGYLDPRAPTLARTMPEREKAERPKRNHNRRPDAKPRTYISRYVGVMEHRNRWIAQWEIGGERVTSTVYPHTPVGAWQAAYARMRALGRDYIEVRPPEQVRPPEPARAPLSERGHAKKPLAGKRIA